MGHGATLETLNYKFYLDLCVLYVIHPELRQVARVLQRTAVGGVQLNARSFRKGKEKLHRSLRRVAIGMED